MKNIFKTKFDLVISIGEDCACTSYLRRCNLQHNSYPFDWLTNAPFENRIELICNDFKDFFNSADLKIMPQPTEFQADVRHDYYENVKNKLYFWHDFPAGIPLNDSYNEVNEKYQRRIKRLYDKIEKSKKILFVWLSHEKLHNSSEIVNNYKKLQTKFNNNEIFLLVIENHQINSQELFEDNHILIIHQDTISDDGKRRYDLTMGNKTNNLRIFKKIKLNLSFKAKFKRILFNLAVFFVKLIPNREIRNNLKSELNMFFYHAKL